MCKCAPRLYLSIHLKSTKWKIVYLDIIHKLYGLRAQKTCIHSVLMHRNGFIANCNWFTVQINSHPNYIETQEWLNFTKNKQIWKLEKKILHVMLVFLFREYTMHMIHVQLISLWDIDGVLCFEFGELKTSFHLHKLNNNNYNIYTHKQIQIVRSQSLIKWNYYEINAYLKRRYICVR